MPDAAARAKLGKVFAGLIERPLRRDLGARALRLLRTLRQPSLVALRHPDDAAFNGLLEQARAFAPAAVVSEFVHVSALRVAWPRLSACRSSCDRTISNIATWPPGIAWPPR